MAVFKTERLGVTVAHNVHEPVLGFHDTGTLKTLSFSAT